MIKRGKIVLTRFPFTDLQSTKRRPAVVVSNESNKTSDYIVAFITSVIPNKLSEIDYFISPKSKDYKQSGLKKPSIIKLDKLATINRTVFSGELGDLEPSAVLEIDLRLKIALDLR